MTTQIHDLGHSAYVGPRTPPARRFWAIARNVFAVAWKSRWGVKLPLIATAGITLTVSVVMYFLRGQLAESVREHGVGIPRAEQLVFMSLSFYMLAAFIMTTIVAAAAVADDLKMGAFLFYFARPLRTRDYVAGKLLGLSLLIGIPMFCGPLALGVVRLILADSLTQALELSPVIGRAVVLGVAGTASFVLPAAGLGALMGKRQNAQALFAVYYLVLQAGFTMMGMWLRAPVLGALSLQTDVMAIGQWLFGVIPPRFATTGPLAVCGLVALCGGGLALVIAKVWRAETSTLGAG